MFLIAGLGNPTFKYRHTRHNVGFDSLDILAKRHGINVNKKEYFALSGRGRISDTEVMLIKPQTYMNRSGESVNSAITRLGLSATDELLVLVDDINLDCGTIRIRTKGSAGGHNGLKDIIKHTGTENFMRIRIGAGKLPQGGDMIKHVLQRPGREDTKRLKTAYDDVADACELIIAGQIQKAMNDYNGR